MPLTQEQQQQLDQQTQFHNGIAKLLNNPHFTDALHELASDPQARQQALNDAAGYFRGKGADIPGMGQGWSVRAHAGSICVYVCFWGYCWNWCTPF